MSMKITKKKAYKTYKRCCRDAPKCGYCLRRVWMGKKYGLYLIERE